MHASVEQRRRWTQTREREVAAQPVFLFGYVQVCLIYIAHL